MRSKLIPAAVLIVACTLILIGQQKMTPIQPTGSLNHTVIDGLPADAAKGAARATAPVPSGCEATSTFIANNQMGVLRCDPANLALYVETLVAQAVKPWADGTLASGAITTAMAATTSTQVIAGTATNYIYLSQCTASNASLTVSTDILLQDGSAGTTLYVLPAPAATTATTGGGGGTFTFPSPLKVPTVGNGLFAANVTTGSSTKLSCSGYKSTTSY